MPQSGHADRPRRAPAGDRRLDRRVEVTEEVALARLNVTAVAPLEPVPLIVTLVPTGPIEEQSP